MTRRKLHYSVGLQAGQTDDGSHDVGNHLQAADPYIVVPTESVECAPETVGQVHPQSHEPHDVQDGHPPCTECRQQQAVGIGELVVGHTLELLQLHVSPEMGQVESQNTQNDDTEHQHVLGCPVVGLALVGYCVAVIAAGLVVGP